MPETYSHSRLATFETCRRQYRYRYIDKLPRQGIGVEAHTGSAVHKALEGLYRSCQKGRIPSQEEVLGLYQQAWEAVPPRQLKIVKPNFVARDYQDLGRYCVQSYYRQFHPFNQSEVLALEARVELFLDAGRQHRLIGYIDRVDRCRDGILEIHDYKTSASLPRTRDLDADRQLTIYEMGLRQRYPEARGFRHVWHYLTFGQTHVRTRDGVHCRRVTEACEAIIQQIKKENRYPASTGILCHWCDFSTECPEGRDYLSRNAPPGLKV
ncbi:MAG: RecB family exonuclease [Acidobacteriota bacterium]